MGPVNDDDEMVTRSAAEVPVRSESQKDAGAVADRGDQEPGVEERLAPGMPGMPGMEEAGYGYGV